MAKYEDKRVLATNGKTYLVRAADYELAEKLHEMWEDYTDDIEENALRIARHVEARAPEQGGEMREALAKAVAIYSQYRTNCQKLREHLYRDWYEQARALLACESTTEPCSKCSLKNRTCGHCGPPAWEGFLPRDGGEARIRGKA